MTVADSVCVAENSEVSIGALDLGCGINVLILDGLKETWAGAQNMASEAGLQWRIPTLNDVAILGESNPDAVSFEFWTATEYPSLDKQGMYVKKLGSEARPEWMGTPSGVILVCNN